MFAYTIFVQLQSLVVISTQADRQSVDITVIVCLFVILSFCMVTDFSAGDKASSVKFCAMVHGHPGNGISHFGELCSPRSQNPTNWRAAASTADKRQSPPLTASVEGSGVYRQYLPSACVDIRPSPKMNVLVCL